MDYGYSVGCVGCVLHAVCDPKEVTYIRSSLLWDTVCSQADRYIISQHQFMRFENEKFLEY